MHLAYAHRLNVAQELARLIAHEINQPLCAISSYNEMCRDLLTVSGPALIERREDIAELVRLIGHHTSRVNDVIRKMRELVRKRMLEREEVDLSRIIGEVVEMYEPIFRKHNILLRISGPKNPPAVMVDAIEIEQVLVSLLRNSIEALSKKQDGRVLEIRSTVLEQRSDEPGVLLVDIRDNGPGIGAVVREKVLRPHFTSKAKGLGFGLPLSRSIIEMHGGEFWIEESTGDGATIHFTLPISSKWETDAVCESNQPSTSSTMTPGSAT
jgi:two-component system sensor kinase FixL